MLNLSIKYNRLLIFVLLWFFSLVVNSQIEANTIFTKPDKENPLMDLAKILFTEEISLSFNISTNLVKASFSDIKNEKKHDSTHLNILLKKLEQDSLNPSVLVDIGTHYENIKYTKLARQYYTKAHKSLNQPLEKIQIKYHIDSARYFTLNGMVKTKLGYSNPINDFKKALTINPLDSIALVIYPVLLLKKDKTEEYDSYALEVNRANTTCKTLPYLMLIMSEIFNKIPDILKSTELSNDSLIYMSNNYEDILNFQNLNAFALSCKENQEIQNARLMIDILGLLVKLVVMDKPSMDKEILNYKSHNNKRLKEYKLKIKSFNPYEINKIQEIIDSLNQLEKAKKLKDLNDADYYKIGRLEYYQGNCLPTLKLFKKIENNLKLWNQIYLQH